MNHRKKMVAIGAATIAGLWLVAWLGISWAGDRAPTPEKVVAYAGSQDLSQLTGEARAWYIDGLADRVDRLTFEQRRELRLNQELERAFMAMTETERLAYLDRVLPRGFKQAMNALNDMDRDERQRLVEQTLKEMREAQRQVGGREFDEPIDEAAMQRIIDTGMATYFSEASAETKIDLQPVIEQMQEILQSGRHLQRERRR